eukprot:6201547-Pleurochrysis_carterae.AAC.4
MSAAAHWDGAEKGTVYAAVALSRKEGMQGYGHGPGQLAGKLVPAISSLEDRGSDTIGHGAQAGGAAAAVRVCLPRRRRSDMCKAALTQLLFIAKSSNLSNSLASQNLALEAD